jgi:hypothetical protein
MLSETPQETAPLRAASNFPMECFGSVFASRSAGILCSLRSLRMTP